MIRSFLLSFLIALILGGCYPVYLKDPFWKSRLRMKQIQIDILKHELEVNSRKLADCINKEDPDRVEIPED